jgi:hypothetical protein
MAYSISMTIQELTARLAQIRESVSISDKVQMDLDRVRSSRNAARVRLRGLAETLSKESRDVERLEGLSLEGLFYQILGNKEDQLDKERQEELAAKLKHDQCKHEVAALDEEYSRLSSRMAEFNDLDAEYESVIRQKEKLLIEQDTAETRQLIALAEKAGTLQASIKELSEAFAAGEAVKSSLEQVVDSLNSARNWGTWDMLGGGFISTHIKHSRIDEARNYVHQAQAQAARFERELADVRLDADLSIQFGAFTKFADYFFDNLITDWIVNSRIEESRNSASSAHAKVDLVLDQLHQRLSDAQRDLSAAVSERRNIIESV